MAKTKDHGYWPGKIIEISNDNKKVYRVRFYDTEVLDVKERDIEKVAKFKEDATNFDKAIAIEYGNKDIQIRKIIDDIKNKTEDRKRLTTKDQYNDIYNKINDEYDVNNADIITNINNIKKFYELENADITADDITNKDTKEIINKYQLRYYRLHDEFEIIPSILEDYTTVIDELILNKENFNKYKGILRTGLKLILKILVPGDFPETEEYLLQEEFNKEIEKSQPRKKRKQNTNIIKNSSLSVNKENEQDIIENSSSSVNTENEQDIILNAKKREIEELEEKNVITENSIRKLLSLINIRKNKIKEILNTLNDEVTSSKRQRTKGGKPKPKSKLAKPEQKPKPKSTKVKQ